MKLKSIRIKILVSILGITFLTVISIAAVFYSTSAQLIEENYISILKQRIHLLSQTIDDMMKDVYYVGIHAASDNEMKACISRYLKTGEEKELEQIAEKLRVYKNREDAIFSMYLLLPETSHIVTSRDYPVYQSIDDDKIVETYIQSTKESTNPVILEDIVANGKNIVSFVEPVENEQGQTIAYICTNIEENKIFYDYFDAAEYTQFKEFLLIKENQVIISNNTFHMGEQYHGDKIAISEKSVVGVDENDIYVYEEGNFSKCGIFAKVERKVVLSDMSKMRNHIIIMAFVFIILSLFPAAYITSVVSMPIKKLVNTIKEVSQGNIEARAEVISKDEIGMLSEQFNQMLEQIQKLIVKVIREEEEKKNAELEALQYQITPHFMYNTLNSIKCAALIKGEKEIAHVIEDFAELLQTCISKKGTFLTVAEEIHILEKYIRLQEFRSGETVQLCYEIQSEAQSCLIPRLILQPLVENALLHGLDMKQKQGKITIRAWVAEETLYLEVEDNGRGMTKEQITNLLTSKTKKTKGLTAIGVTNVRDRIKLYYKQKGVLYYESSKEGTTAKLYLPKQKGEEAL